MAKKKRKKKRTTKQNYLKNLSKIKNTIIKHTKIKTKQTNDWQFRIKMKKKEWTDHSPTSSVV
jgi:hypothetical protein